MRDQPTIGRVAVSADDLEWALRFMASDGAGTDAVKARLTDAVEQRQQGAHEGAHEGRVVVTKEEDGRGVDLSDWEPFATAERLYAEWVTEGNGSCLVVLQSRYVTPAQVVRQSIDGQEVAS